MTYSTVFLGTAPFGIPVMRSLKQDDRVDIKGVFTQPDRKKGRGQQTQSPPVATTARDLDLPLFQPESINEEGVSRLREFEDVDFGIVIAYGQILSEQVLGVPRNGFFNFHASLLPRWRGAAPIRHALINGDEETGVTIFQVERELDTGPICVTLKIPVREDETYGSLYDRLSQVNVGALKIFLSDLDNDRLNFEEQAGEAMYAPRIKTDDSKIDWTRPSEEIELFVRAFSPDPGAFTFLNGDRFKIYRTEIFGRADRSAGPGEIVELDSSRLIVGTGEGCLSLKEVQPSGSRRMSVEEFLAGNPDIQVGDQFDDVPS